jgi:thioredoxin-like negative regulator of GroEL
MNRRQRIESMLEKDPTDAFLRYGLALELEKEGDDAESLRRLRELMNDSIPYVPAFFMAAQQLVRRNRVTEAREVLRVGIEQARTQHDLHAAGEMSEYLANLGISEG